MLRLGREGYARDLLALLIITTLLGGAAVGGAAYAFDRYFDRAVSELMGAPGEYDLLIHLQSDVGTPGINALGERLETVAPGFQIKLGPTLAGRMNVFIGLPDTHRHRQSFESIGEHLRDLPGFDGYTFVVEPSVIVKDTHPGSHPVLMEKIDRIDGVRFSFSHGNSLWVVLNSRDVASGVQAEIERITEEMSIVDVRFSSPLSPSERAEAEERLVSAILAHDAHLQIDALRARAGGASWANDLVEIRRLLDQVAAGSDTSLVNRLSEVAGLLEQVGAGEAGGTEGAAAALDAFYAAIDQMAALQERLDMLEEQLLDVAGSSSATNLIISMLVQNLIGMFTGEQQDDLPPLEGPLVDPGQLQAGLDQLASHLSMFQELDLLDLSGSLRELEQFIGGLDVEALNRAIHSIDRLIELEGTSDQRMEILLQGEPGPNVVNVAQDALVPLLSGQGSGVSVFLRPAGIVEADVRTTLLVLIDTAGDLVKVLVALFVTTLFFFLDTTTLLSFLRARHRALGLSGWQSRLQLALSGGAWFSLMVVVTLWLGGETIPFPAPLLIGAFLLGALGSLASPRISPLDPNQLEAAASVGLRWADILRKVVIPGGRPGLLYLINRPFSRPLSNSYGR